MSRLLVESALVTKGLRTRWRDDVMFATRRGSCPLGAGLIYSSECNYWYIQYLCGKAERSEHASMLAQYFQLKQKRRRYDIVCIGLVWVQSSRGAVWSNYSYECKVLGGQYDLYNYSYRSRSVKQCDTTWSIYVYSNAISSMPLVYG